ncbi:MAG: hypothetical protein ACKPKO_38190, partial [Candidatus Fonsibacter sp.]
VYDILKGVIFPKNTDPRDHKHSMITITLRLLRLEFKNLSKIWKVFEKNVDFSTTFLALLTSHIITLFH